MISYKIWPFSMHIDVVTLAMITGKVLNLILSELIEQRESVSDVSVFDRSEEVHVKDVFKFFTRMYVLREKSESYEQKQELKHSPSDAITWPQCINIIGSSSSKC
jgi:hypothetical protein